jgi:hypothetical protein
VGFYFGTTSPSADRLELAVKQEITSEGELSIFGYVRGGTPPYKYEILLGNDTVDSGVTDSGFIVSVTQLGDQETYTINVTDSRSVHLEKDGAIEAPTSSTVTNGEGDTTPQNAGETAKPDSSEAKAGEGGP